MKKKIKDLFGKKIVIEKDTFTIIGKGAIGNYMLNNKCEINREYARQFLINK